MEPMPKQRVCRILNAGDDALREACTALLAGEVVAIPTETVYGLAADATNGSADSNMGGWKKVYDSRAACVSARRRPSTY